MAFTLIVFGLIFLVGLVMGSFLNVVILRTVSGESIVFPASKCPKCQTPLKWYHNIPVLSYLFLGGKCAFCKERISIQYPLVELLTACLFLGLFIKTCSPIDPFFGLAVMAPFGIYQLIVYVYLLIVAFLFLAIAGTDILEQKVADAHTIPLIVVGVLYSLIYSILTIVMYHDAYNIYPKFSWELVSTSPIFHSVCGAIIGFLLMEALARLGEVLVGKRTFGEGDSYIAAGLGAVFCGLMGTHSVNFSEALMLLLKILVGSGIVQLIITLPMIIKKFIVNKNWYTLISLSVFTLYASGFVWAKYANLLNSSALYNVLTIILAILGLVACKGLLGSLKNNTEGGMYLPFGPAMIVAGFITMFTMSYFG